MWGKAHSGEIPIPDDASRNAESIELLRVWLSCSEPSITLRAETYPDPAVWGAILGDVARQVATAYGEDRGLMVGSVLGLIRAGFDRSVSAAS